ncbi:TetR/AcrR family transcriptional regulator [Brevibacillus humidisoli]|uniref:TetR/AcrR family transcriptional regulator n=1 Tax=Brevibacillus humidisoli TaxID=2895522 RepID=UPI001E49C75F|nr:TetR/AcrR family transcriptional regulator [Brevibacillus humidisoli]UFJ41374.1 TetR/AcrR family transcriptional regulator [Brevibacillus humidisoli]
MDGFQERTEKKKTAILMATKRLLRQYPPNKVSIRDVAEEADVSVVTIYNHFGSKDRLILEIVRQVVEEQLACFETILQSDDPFPEKWKALLFNKTETLADFHPEFANFMMLQPDIRDYLTAVHQVSSSGMIQRLIEQGQRAGYINPELNVSLIMSVFELFRQDLASKDSLLLSTVDLSQDHEKIFDILFYGISGKRND